MAHLHILGICGTFMGGIAGIAVSMGHRVTGSDANTYPPMSTQLEQLGVVLYEGYEKQHLQPKPDLVLIGNAMSRGNVAVEYLLNSRIPYTSGPDWLYQQVLKEKWVLAVSGTHGKTTTTSMLAWILEYCGYQPGYLIGGVPANFEKSARLTESAFFVIEADEYDSAFFDKRSKMVHYHPSTLTINNLEFDHADIFKDIAAIQTQFHHLVRTVPSNGKIIYPENDEKVTQVLAMGCWSDTEPMGESGQWHTRLINPDGSQFKVFNHSGKEVAEVKWDCIGEHNVNNGLTAILAARHVGVVPQFAAEALAEFKGVSRRMELKTAVAGIRLYDDFAHHPTAIKLTLEGLRQKSGSKPIFTIVEPRSNTMRMGVHKEALVAALKCADRVWIYLAENISWDLPDTLQHDARISVASSVEEIINKLMAELTGEEQIVVMSNGGFDGLTSKLQLRLEDIYAN